MEDGKLLDDEAISHRLILGVWSRLSEFQSQGGKRGFLVESSSSCKPRPLGADCLG